MKLRRSVYRKDVMPGRDELAALLHPQQYRLHAGLQRGVEARVLLLEMMRLGPPDVFRLEQRLARAHLGHHPLERGPQFRVLPLFNRMSA